MYTTNYLVNAAILASPFICFCAIVVGLLFFVLREMGVLKPKSVDNGFSDYLKNREPFKTEWTIDKSTSDDTKTLFIDSDNDEFQFYAQEPVGGIRGDFIVGPNTISYVKTGSYMKVVDGKFEKVIQLKRRAVIEHDEQEPSSTINTNAAA